MSQSCENSYMKRHEHSRSYIILYPIDSDLHLTFAKYFRAYPNGFTLPSMLEYAASIFVFLNACI